MRQAIVTGSPTRRKPFDWLVGRVLARWWNGLAHPLHKAGCAGRDRPVLRQGLVVVEG
jgi:hypothetical protein